MSWLHRYSFWVESQDLLICDIIYWAETGKVRWQGRKSRASPALRDLLVPAHLLRLISMLIPPPTRTLPALVTNREPSSRSLLGETQPCALQSENRLFFFPFAQGNMIKKQFPILPSEEIRRKSVCLVLLSLPPPSSPTVLNYLQKLPLQDQKNVSSV